MSSVSAKHDPVVIRRATLEDAHLLSTLGAETFRETFAESNSPRDMELYLAEAFSLDVQERELRDVRSMSFVAHIGAEPVGYARLLEGDVPAEITGARPLEIVRIYARTAWVGRGIGAALMTTCLRAAIERGCDTVWLGVWERNTRAIAFYERWGFKRVGSHAFRLGEDLQTDWLMQRATNLEV